MSGTNTLDGGAGNDVLIGGIGSDTLRGGSENDVLIADTTDFLVGNDTLDGGSGDDLLEGGSGSDLFIFRPDEGDNIIANFDLDMNNPLTSQAVGADFAVGFDKVQLTNFGYSEFSQISTFITAGANGAVFSDQNTSITFHDVTVGQLTEDDFIFV